MEYSLQECDIPGVQEVDARPGRWYVTDSPEKVIRTTAMCAPEDSKIPVVFGMIRRKVQYMGGNDGREGQDR